MMALEVGAEDKLEEPLAPPNSGTQRTPAARPPQRSRFAAQPLVSSPKVARNTGLNTGQIRAKVRDR